MRKRKIRDFDKAMRRVRDAEKALASDSSKVVVPKAIGKEDCAAADALWRTVPDTPVKMKRLLDAFRRKEGLFYSDNPQVKMLMSSLRAGASIMQNAGMSI